MVFLLDLQGVAEATNVKNFRGVPLFFASFTVSYDAWGYVLRLFGKAIFLR